MGQGVSMMQLSELPPGSIAIITGIDAMASDDLRQRLVALGIVAGQSVQVLRTAGWGGPLHIRVGATTEVAIRRQEATRVWVRWP